MAKPTEREFTFLQVCFTVTLTPYKFLQSHCELESSQLWRLSPKKLFYTKPKLINMNSGIVSVLFK